MTTRYPWEYDNYSWGRSWSDYPPENLGDDFRTEAVLDPEIMEDLEASVH